MGDTKLQIQNASFRRPRYPISPGGGTPIMMLRQFVYVAQLMPFLRSSFQIRLPLFSEKRNSKPPLYTEKSPFC